MGGIFRRILVVYVCIYDCYSFFDKGGKCKR